MDWGSGGILGFTLLLISAEYLSFITAKRLMKKTLELSSLLLLRRHWLNEVNEKS